MVAVGEGGKAGGGRWRCHSGIATCGGEGVQHPKECNTPRGDAPGRRHFNVHSKYKGVHPANSRQRLVINNKQSQSQQ